VGRLTRSRRGRKRKQRGRLDREEGGGGEVGVVENGKETFRSFPKKKETNSKKGNGSGIMRKRNENGISTI
jgi:hypothetical protein